MVLESRHRTREQDGPVRAVTVSARRTAEMEVFNKSCLVLGVGTELEIAAFKQRVF